MEICKKVAQCIEELWVLDYKGPAFLRNISDKTDGVACDMEVSSNNIVFTYNKYLNFSRCTKPISNVSIALDGKTLYSDELFLKQFPLPLIYTTRKVYTHAINKSDKYFIRMIFKIDKAFRLDMYITDCKPSRIENMGYTSNLIQVNAGKKFDSYVFQYNNVNFLALECRDLLDIAEFRKYTHAIMISLGFISGTFVNTTRCIFYSREQDFSKIENVDFIIQNSSVKSQFPPIAKNVNGYEDFLEEDMRKSFLNFKKNNKFLMTNAEFAELCKLSFHNVEVLGSIFMILESSACSLDTMGAMLCVTLESLSSFILKNTKDNILPIKNKNNWNKLKSQLLKQLDEDFLKTENGLEVIAKKLENLNSPTNADKLTKPFELLGINLSKEDTNILQKRNHFLHGVFAKIEEIDIQNNPPLAILIKTCLRLNLLSSVLILKLCDYIGWVPTYAHLHEDKQNLTLDKLFRFVGNQEKSTSD